MASRCELAWKQQFWIIWLMPRIQIWRGGWRLAGGGWRLQRRAQAAAAAPTFFSSVIVSIFCLFIWLKFDWALAKLGKWGGGGGGDRKKKERTEAAPMQLNRKSANHIAPSTELGSNWIQTRFTLDLLGILQLNPINSIALLFFSRKLWSDEIRKDVYNVNRIKRKGK